MKWIRFKYYSQKTGGAGNPMWVSEKNRFFKWYKDSIFYQKIEEEDR